MTMNNNNNNDQVLDETSRLQDATKAALSRMRRRAEETHAVGAATLDALQTTQRQTMAQITNETYRLHANLDQTEKLQNKLSRWTLTFNRRKARRQAKEEIRVQDTQRATIANIQKKVGEEELQDRLAQAQDRRDTKQAWKELEYIMNIAVQDEDRKGTEASRDRHQMPAVSETPSWRPQHTKTAAGGINTTPQNVEERLEEIQQKDEEIDHALDGLGQQIEGLLALSKTQQDELHVQESVLDHVHDNIETAHAKQKTVNHRTKGFLVGKWRH